METVTFGPLGTGAVVLAVTAWMLVGALNAWIARRKGRSRFTWFWLSSWFGLLGTVFLVLGDRARPLQRGFDVPGTREDGRLAPERPALVVAAVASVLTDATVPWDWPLQLSLDAVLLGTWVVFVWRREVAERRAGETAEA